MLTVTHVIYVHNNIERGYDHYVPLIMDNAHAQGLSGKGEGGTIVSSPQAAEIKRHQRKYFK
jgi:hypothetical protein